MPPNKPRDAQTNPSRPLMPTLASSRNVKSPITPRLAATPPLAKSVRSNTPSNIKSPGAKEDLSTPARAFVANNVTPRSSSRKSRVDSNHTTPSGTPNLAKATPQVDALGSGGRQAPFPGLGLGIVGSGSKSIPNSVVGGGQGPLSPSVVSQSRFPRSDDHGNGSMFFHANEVPSSPELPVTTRKSPVFFFANGEQDETARPSSHPSPPLSSVSARSKPGQFFHANGMADDDVPPVPSLPSPPAITHLPQFFQNLPSFRPPSPTKDSIHLTYRKGASQILRPNERPKAVAVLPPNNVDVTRKRSTSGGTPKVSTHKRTSSLSSIESGSSARKTTSAGPEAYGLTPLQTVLSSSNAISNDPLSAPTTARIPVSIPEDEVSLDHITAQPSLSRQAPLLTPTLSLPQSPTKAPGEWQPQLAETIMNARVERKIQDLEISNSSLMAINKSLEKEVRRQNKELRRFRRLSRAGRLSTLSNAESQGSILGGESEFGGIHDLSVLEELSENEELEDDEDDDDDDDSSDESSSPDISSLSLSDSAIAERQEKKLIKDSKRLQLDLARHREILVDSQKLNQSLKRCMAWTEMMIKDGRKALEYKADPESGGRILDDDELPEDGGEEEDDGPRHSLLSSWTPSPLPALEALDGILGIDTATHTRRSWQSEEGVDSGIDLDSGRASKVIMDSLPEHNIDAAAAVIPSQHHC